VIESGALTGSRARIYEMKLLYTAVLALFFSFELSAQTATLHGQVTDPTGAVIPNATVTLRSAAGRALKTATANADGVYEFTQLTPGRYLVQASAPDLALHKPLAVTLKPGRQALNIQMQVATVVQQVTVQENAGPTVSTSPSNNVGALVLTGKDLQDLSDDPDELQEDLQALAGPAAGPNGGSIYIDGFSGGELPPKDSIREIRINQNPFSPEFDKLGFGRIEIFTKPGTNQFHGDAFFNFSDDKFNARNPYAQEKAPFRMEEYDASLSGPINKRASFFLSAFGRNIDNGSVINAVTLDPDTLSIVDPYTATYLTPQSHYHITPRVDYQLSTNNTLTLRYGYMHNGTTGGNIGNFNLISQGENSSTTDQTVQAMETYVINANTINEMHFQYYRTDSQTIANNSGAAIDVSGAFNGGGAQVGHSYNTGNNYEFQNYVSLIHGRHSWNFGVRVRANTVDEITPSNFGGTFTFTGGLAPELDANNQAVLDDNGQPILTQITSIESYQRTLLFQQMGYSPAQIRALGGGATQFTISSGNPEIYGNQEDVGAFVNDDWRVRPNLTLSLGMRYEAQTNISDWGDWAPRIGFAWAPGGGAKGARPKTVLRGGFGLFYDRFALSNVLTAERYNGILQQQYVASCPSDCPDFYPNIPPVSSLATTATSTRWEVASKLQAPYLIQSAISIERQLPRNTTAAVTYTNTHGLHQLRSADINAPLPGTYQPDVPDTGVYPYGPVGPIFLMESSGLYNQNQIMFNVNSRLSQNISLFGYYMWNRAMSNTDGVNTFAADPYDYSGEYGPASTDIHNRLFFGGSVNTFWSILLNPFVIVQSGAPFDITIPTDVYGTTILNARPGIPTDLSKAGLIDTPYGLLDPNPTPGEAILPRNYGRGPGMISINLRVGKTFGFGAPREGAVGYQGGGQHWHGHGGTGAHFGAPSGHSWFGGTSTPRRYNLTVSVSGRNILNHTNPGPIIGNIASPLFGEANRLASGGFGAGAANNRIVQLQLRFMF
jgi:Carboxypeptidase regulatory-like domain